MRASNDTQNRSCMCAWHCMTECSQSAPVCTKARHDTYCIGLNSIRTCVIVGTPSYHDVLRTFRWNLPLFFGRFAWGDIWDTQSRELLVCVGDVRAAAADRNVQVPWFLPTPRTSGRNSTASFLDWGRFPRCTGVSWACEWISSLSWQDRGDKSIGCCSISNCGSQQSARWLLSWWGELNACCNEPTNCLYFH